MSNTPDTGIGRRMEVVFTAEAAAELARLERESGLTPGQMLQGGISLMRQRVAGIADGLTELTLLDDPSNPPQPQQKLLF